VPDDHKWNDSMKPLAIQNSTLLVSDDKLKGNVKTPLKDKTMDTVLVVEDSRAMQRTLQRLLEADSLNVQIASDGISGLESFRKQQPSAVLLDLKLPGLSGKELCREFKSLAGIRANRSVECQCGSRRQSALAGARRRRLRHQAFQPQGAARASPPRHAARSGESSAGFQRSGEKR